MSDQATAKPAYEPHNYHQIRQKFEETWPAVFTPRKTAPKPLKINVRADILTRIDTGQAEPLTGLSAKKIFQFLNQWTRRTEYQKALRDGAVRYDLDGNVAGEVTNGHRHFATQELWKRKLAAKHKRKNKKPAQKDAA